MRTRLPSTMQEARQSPDSSLATSLRQKTAPPSRWPGRTPSRDARTTARRLTSSRTRRQRTLLDLSTFGEFAGKDRKRTRRRVQRTQALQRPARDPARELLDLEHLNLAKVKGTFLEAKRRGTLRASPRAKLAEPTAPRAPKPGPTPARAGQRHYTDQDREDVAYQIVEAVLRDTHPISTWRTPETRKSLELTPLTARRTSGLN